MSNLLFTLFMGSAAGLFLLIWKSMQKNFTERVLKQLNAKDEYKIEAAKIFIVGLSTSLRAISIYKDEIVVSERLHRSARIDHNTYSKSQIDSVVLTNGLLRLMPKKDVSRLGKFIDSLSGTSELGLTSLRRPSVFVPFNFTHRRQVADELRQELISLGYTVTDQKPALTKSRKTLLYIIVFLLAVVLVGMVGIMQATN